MTLTNFQNGISSFGVPILGSGSTASYFGSQWFVNTVTVATFIRTKPIVLQLELRLAPASNIIYDFQLGECGIGGSAREPEDPCLRLPDPTDDLEWCPPVPEA